ncbi:MAG: ABC-F type ribosomal protection protein [Clostridia bacterium]|nr:ABC-F type ribosomal protection protein [Clostridia bacterium]
MAEIVLRGIEKSYGTHQILKGVSFEIYEGTVVGLLGRNGAGKTTLFKILSGLEPYDKGEMSIVRGRRVGILDQIPEYAKGTTVWQVLDSAFEQLYALRSSLDEMEARMLKDSNPILVKQYGTLLSEFEGRGGYTIETSIKRVCTGLGIDEMMQQRQFSELSGGEKTRVNLARIILMDPHILLLDEPTNHLDVNAIEWLEEYLETFEGTVVVISHDRYFLDKVAEKIIEIEDGVALSYEGNYSKYALLKEQRRIEQLQHYEQEQKKIRQLELAVKRMHDWANRADSKKMHRRAFGMEKRLDRMVKSSTERPKVEKKLTQTFKVDNFSGMEVITLKGISKSFEQKRVLDQVNLLVKKSDRLALLGNNGTGKTTLLKIIQDELEPDAGIVKIGPSVKMAYLPQIVTFDEPELTILDTVRRQLIIDEGKARNLLAGFLFRGEDVFKTVGSLSGGERSRLKLCLLMQSGVNLLILDEPTNHLDIASREWMEEVLEEFEGTILFVSHDRYFIRKFAQTVCELENGKLYFYEGSYEDYREFKRFEEQEKQRLEQERLLLEKPKVDSRIKKPSPKALEKRIQKVEEDIARAEQRLEEIESELERYASDYERLNALLYEKGELEARHEELLASWMGLSKDLEAMGQG